jgi:hypothetical protein
LTRRRGAGTRGRGLIRLGDEIGQPVGSVPNKDAWSPQSIGAVGGTLDTTAMVKVKFTTNLPVKMAAAAFGVGVSVRNGRNVPFELRNPNTPFMFDPA